MINTTNILILFIKLIPNQIYIFNFWYYLKIECTNNILNNELYIKTIIHTIILYWIINTKKNHDLKSSIINIYLKYVTYFKNKITKINLFGVGSPWLSFNSRTMPIFQIIAYI